MLKQERYDIVIAPVAERRREGLVSVTSDHFSDWENRIKKLKGKKFGPNNSKLENVELKDNVFLLLKVTSSINEKDIEDLIAQLFNNAGLTDTVKRDGDKLIFNKNVIIFLAQGAGRFIVKGRDDGLFKSF